MVRYKGGFLADFIAQIWLLTARFTLKNRLNAVSVLGWMCSHCYMSKDADDCLERLF